MTQDEFETLVKQFFKEGTILYIVEPQSADWLNPATRSSMIFGPATPELRQMARVVRDTAIKGNKVVGFAQELPLGHSLLETEVDVVATIGFDLNGLPGASILVIKKWRAVDAIPSPGVWPLTK